MTRAGGRSARGRALGWWTHSALRARKLVGGCTKPCATAALVVRCRAARASSTRAARERQPTTDAQTRDVGCDSRHHRGGRIATRSATSELETP